MVAEERIKTTGSLKTSIEAVQEGVVKDLGGKGWKRAATYTRTLVTMLGVLNLRIVKVRDASTGRVTSPILDMLAIRRRKYSREVKIVCADMAARLSYNDSKIEFEKTTGIVIPKRTIHSFVQEIGALIASSPRKANDIVLMADGTKTHSVYSTDNEVRVAISCSPEGKSLFGLTVNKGWDSIPKATGPHILVSDAERSIRSSLAENSDDIQLDLVHAVKESLFKLWGEGMSKQERDEVSREMKIILFTLVNSVKKHREDKDFKAIETRVESTLIELRELARHLWRRGYRKASNFISHNARLMVTFAKLVTIGLDVPYTSNIMERMMGEVAKRCKHKWAHWSTKGLENMLWILLIRYTDTKSYEVFWKQYIHPSRIGLMPTTP